MNALTIDTKALMTLFPNLDEIPACDVGMELARKFLESCGDALETGNAANFNARFESYNRHRANCEKCNEV